jgi:diguanylate cyclase (GGDEF)-like protein
MGHSFPGERRVSLPVKYFSWRALFLVVVVAALVGGAVAIERSTIFRLLHDDAASTATAWTEFLAENTDDVSRIAAGAAATEETKAFVAKVKTVARVFLYKIYDAEGVPRFVSDDLEEEETDSEDLALHNPEAAEAIEKGAPEVEVKDGTPPSRPAFYAEAYVPLIKNGKLAGVVEAYIDQTAKRAEFERTSLLLAITLGLLIAAAFGVPAVAWYFRKSQHERSEAHVHYLANFDALSGLANRSSLAEQLSRAVADAARRGEILAVHCVDIDSFKDINDRFGLATGDRMIRIAAERLASVAGPDDIVARLGGDEFALVQKAPRGRMDVEVYAHKIARAMSAPVTVGGEEIAMTAGVGVALAPEHGKNAERLIKSAELALAKGKSEGRAYLRIFTPDLDSETSARLTLERTIETALATGGFSVHFQPLYAEPTEALVGFEALARLKAEDGSYIPPVDFIAAAERMGVIHRLGAWVLQEACAAATNWPEHLTVSVNLSPAQFAKESIADLVATVLRRTGLRPGRLLLEITESLLLTDNTAIMAELARLKALGAEIVMDDFGTGYSSLGYLWRFPFSKIKIDGSFMRAFDTPGAPAEKIVRTIVTLGHALGMRVCVEGVETAGHADHARALGCDEVQGFHFARPMPTSEVPAAILANFRQQLEAGQNPGREPAPRPRAIRL